MKQVRLIIFLGLCVFIHSACHKYPEDQFISFQRSGSRLQGNWRFLSYKINGTEHIHDFDSLLNPFSLSECVINFEHFHDKVFWGVYKILDPNGKAVYPNDGMGYSIFRNKTMSFESGTTDIPYSSANHIFYFKLWKTSLKDSTHWNFPEWSVLRLYKNDLHLRYNGTEIYLKKQ